MKPITESQREPEKFFAIRRTDGESLYDEFGWMSCDGPDDWEVAEQDSTDWADDESEPIEYEIVEMTVRSLEKRAFPEPSA